MPEISIVSPSKIQVVSEDDSKGRYEVHGLYPGYGHTLGNSLRRILLSSLPGTAITNVKIAGVNNEFSTIDGVKEDVITILLNLKNARVQMDSTEPQILTLKVKGVKTIVAGDIETTGQTTIINPDQEIATLTDKNAEIDMEITVERGLGYLAKEHFEQNKADVGIMKMDASFTPIRRVNYEVENMRVGERTDYNRLIISIETDGTISPREALDKSVAIMVNQLNAMVSSDTPDNPEDKTIEYTPSKFEEVRDQVLEEKGSQEDFEDGDDETEFLKTRVESLDLSQRTQNALSNANIRTVGGLARKKEADIRDIEGLGDKGIKEIKKLLSKHDVELKE